MIAMKNNNQHAVFKEQQSRVGGRIAPTLGTTKPLTKEPEPRIPDTKQ